MSTLTPLLQDQRLDLVREHMRSENEHRFEDTLATFDHPRYEIVPTGDVYDGAREVAEYYRASRTAFARSSATWFQRSISSGSC